MSRRAWVVEDGRVILIKGYQVADELRDAGYRPIYLGTRKAFSLDRRHMSDVVALFERLGRDVVVNVPRPVAVTTSVAPASEDHVDDEVATVDQGDLLDLIANDPRHEEDWHRFVTACQTDAAAHGGLVSVNRVRGLLSNAYGLDIEPRRYASLWQRATKAGVMVNTDEWETCTDSRGRNSGKPQRIRRWVGRGVRAQETSVAGGAA